MEVSFRRLAFAFGWAAVCWAILGTALFLIAGRRDLPWFWSYLAVCAVLCLSRLLLLDTGLRKERFRPGPKARDTALVAIAKVLALAHLVIAALDAGRFGWSGEVPAAAQAVGLALVALAGAGTVWTMRVNRFFSTVVRIQEEREHQVITGGPYRVVRHPGYVVMSVLVLASGVALGSWWAILPMGVLVMLMIRRTAIEDRFLHEHLPGYADYARQVRYRLLPGVW